MQHNIKNWTGRGAEILTVNYTGTNCVSSTYSH